MMAAVDFGHHELVRWLLGRGATRTPAPTPSRGRRRSIRRPGTAIWRWPAFWSRPAPIRGARDGQYDNTPLGWAETAVAVTNNPRCAEVAWLKTVPGAG